MSYWDFSFNHFELYSKEDFIISNSCLHFEVYNVFYYVYLDAVLTTLYHIPIIKKKINPHYLRPKPKSINFYLHFTQIQESSEATDFCMEEATTPNGCICWFGWWGQIGFCYHMVLFLSWASGLKAAPVSLLLLCDYFLCLPLVPNLEIGLRESRRFTWPSHCLFVSKLVLYSEV